MYYVSTQELQEGSAATFRYHQVVFLLESSTSIFYERLPKSIAKEVKLGASVVSGSVLIFDLHFLRMQFQSALL